MPSAIQPASSLSGQPQPQQAGDRAGARRLGIRWKSPAGVYWRQCLQPALLAASDRSRIQRLFGVTAKLCDYTCQTLRGRQTHFPCLQVPA